MVTRGCRTTVVRWPENCVCAARATRAAVSPVESEMRWISIGVADAAMCLIVTDGAYAVNARDQAFRRSSSRADTAPIGTRTCSSESRSRTVTASSSSDSWSTVIAHGVPISSCRR